MPITNDNELDAALTEAGRLLQEIQDFIGNDLDMVARVRFPRGFLRTAAEHRHRLSFMRNATLKANVSYSFMLSDIYLWLIVRTDIGGTAREMIIKAAVFLAGAIIESINRDYLSSVMGQRRAFKERTRRLVSDGVIIADLKTELDWVWDTRNKMHLFLATRKEHGHYVLNDYRRAATAVRDLLSALSAAT